MTEAPLRFASYAWRGGSEAILTRGVGNDCHVLVIPPLFEEMNFGRALLAEIGRILASCGVTTWLPDLPGTGESLVRLETLGWLDWREAMAGAASHVAASTGRPPLTCAFRGGALLDGAAVAAARWRYASASGAALLRQLRQVQRITASEAGTDVPADAEIVYLAGYPLSRALRDGLMAAKPDDMPHRDALGRAGTPPWRRAEPAPDRELAQYLAADIGDWAAGCASS